MEKLDIEKCLNTVIEWLSEEANEKVMIESSTLSTTGPGEAESITESC